MCSWWHLSVLLWELLQRNAPVKTCNSPTPRNLLNIFNTSCSFFQKCKDSKGCEPILVLPHYLGSKACSPFFCGWKSYIKGKHLQVRKFFCRAKLNDNYRSVLCACLITSFLCPKGKKRKAQCVFRQPHGDILCTLGVHWNTLIWMSAFTPPWWLNSFRFPEWWVTWNL